ncbi:protein white-like [Mercenaria mercenaria]|uniref:protein white-like n=1 Tax=Mercenaria mercenaria TaxID=6596 RepID=UPI00234E7884|nr:protein white-like [Mercenaria mercenaria]XP_045168961.2 protein white-like [Mercenaria mercenaria]XP_053373527.1 protein white-like [Mercenaria mercenaria]
MPVNKVNVEMNGNASDPSPHYEKHQDRKGTRNNHVLNIRNEAHHALIDSTETVVLSWENVNVSASPKTRTCCSGNDVTEVPKQIIRNAYGHVKPGTLLAIIGASGSGKTMLLNALASNTDSESLTSSGDVMVNGVKVGNGIRNISAYVQQDDHFIATMTVKEHLTFRALLRMEKEVSKKRRLERVDEVILELGLRKCQDTIIGHPGRIKGISGGEMKRLSFASEILTNPPLLFCDEPTSGLDSFMAESIVQTLKEMADKGKTVLCSIHQPSSEVFALFHHVLIIAAGRVAFLGDTEEALNFYKNIGYPCPVNFNPADFYIMTMAIVPGKEEECKQRIEKICDQFDQTTNAKAILQQNKNICENPERTGVIFEEAFSSKSRYEASWIQQFGSVFARSWTTTIREPMVIKVRTAQTIVLAVVLGLLYLQLDLTQEGVMNINGVMYLMLLNMTFVNMFAVLSSFPLEAAVFSREYRSGLYGVDIYFMCKVLAELPSFVIIPAVFCGISYWMVGLYSSLEAFLMFTAVLLLVANVSVSYGYIVSTMSNSVSMALALAPPMMMPLFMFGGFFVNTETNPVYFIWLEYLSWFRYSNELLVVNQWDNIDTITCDSNNATASNRCLYKNGQQVINYLNFDKDNFWLNVGLLILLLIVYRLIAFIILFVKARISKK